MSVLLGTSVGARANTSGSSLTRVDAFDTFNRKYGVLTDKGTYEVPAAWQAGLSNGCQIGEIVGLFGECFW
jgi:hypothetical protein